MNPLSWIPFPLSLDNESWMTRLLSLILPTKFVDGYRLGDNVIVLDLKAITKLWRHGCYGRGLWSRSQPGFLSNTSSRAPREGGSKFTHENGKEMNKLLPPPLNAVKTEPLVLTPVEVLFLIYSVPTLRVSEHNKPTISRDLIPNYVAYNHFRSKGWVVRPGTKFGCDLMLYPPGGPVAGHAEWGVLVRSPLGKGDFGNDIGNGDCEYEEQDGHLLWRDVLLHQRVLSNVKKGLLVAWVGYSGEGSQAASYGTKDMRGFLEHFFVLEIGLTRFNANRR